MIRALIESLRLRFGLRRGLCRPRFPMATPNAPRSPAFRIVQRDEFAYIEPRPARWAS